MKIYFTLLFSLLISFNSSKAQDKSNAFGLVLEYAVVGHTLNGNLNYNPWLIGGIFSLQAHEFNTSWSLSFDFVPLLGIDFSDQNNLEAGLNIRASLNLEINPISELQFKIGSGPYWIDVETGRQANGFIFSDYFLLGYKLNLGNHAVNWYIAYRHLSNLSFQKPNGGINNLIAGIGFYF